MSTRVLFLHGSAGRYGADRQLLALATGLDGERFRPLVVLGEDGELASLLTSAGVDVRVEPLPVLRRGLTTGRGAPALAARVARARVRIGRLARESGVTIVHTNTSNVLCGHAVARRAGAAHLIHVREVYEGIGGLLTQRLWPRYRRHLLRADGLACVSRAVATQFDGSGRAFVLHDGVPRRLVAAPRLAARRALGIDPERVVVAVVGRVSDWKGQHVLARALAEPALASVGAIGLVAGDAAPGQARYERELVTLRSRLGLGDRLRLLGFRDDVETIFGAADVVAAPSTRGDALPNAVLEAAAAGVPLVASASGGLPEIVRDGETGRLFAAGDARALAATIAELAADRAQAQRVGAAAAADVRARFGLQRMLDGVHEAYGHLLAARA